MSDVTSILTRLEQGDSQSTEKLLPLVYHELRKLAAIALSQERPGQTLQTTALVHEAYLRLVGNAQGQPPLWRTRGYFFAAAAEAMRRILVENARRKLRIKHGGQRQRIDLDDANLATNLPPDELVLLNDALDELAAHDATAAELVKLRYFAGLSVDEAAKSLETPRTTAYRHWTYARAWLISRVQASHG